MTVHNKKSENSAKARKAEITLLNALFCLAVIFIHLLSEPVEALVRGTFWHSAVFVLQRILFCAVYGFIFLSAEKTALSMDKNKSTFEFYLRRARRIIPPYLAAVLVYYAVNLATGALSFNFKELMMYIVRGNLAAHFYFVPVIVQFYILAPFVFRFYEKYGAKITLSAALILNLAGAVFLCGYDFYACLFVKYLLCYVVGWCVGRNYERFAEIIHRHKTAVYAFYAAALCLELLFSYFGGRVIAVQQSVTAVYMPLAVVFLYTLVKNRSERFGCAAHLVGAGSYYIYLWHVLFIMLADMFLSSFAAGLFTRFILRSAITLFLSACIPVAMYAKNVLTSRMGK